MPDKNRKSTFWLRTLRGLRMRLAATYVLLFALALVGLGFVFRQSVTGILNQQSERVLDEEWRAMKAYLRFQRGELMWTYDPEDAEEAYAVDRLRRVLLLTDERGNVLELSNGYSALGSESMQQIRSVVRSNEPVTVVRRDFRGETYLVRMGIMRDQGRAFFVAIGLPVEDTLRIPNHLLRQYLLSVPVMLLVIVFVGWYMAGRALRPLHQVAETASAVAGGNLSLRIVPRGSGDELDVLIGAFNQMLERLELNFQQIRQFSIDASHELRTPITIIRGQLEVALFTAETREQFREAIMTALLDVERMGQIVKSLLLLEQAESGQVVLQKTPYDITRLSEELVSQFRVASDEKGIDLEVVALGPCWAEVDRVQFDRLLSNLLSNALKYTHAGGRVEVILEQAEGAAHLIVSDNGQGIPAANLPHVFERFYRVRETTPDPDRGLGLGLAFVAWIARAHGGRVEVKSEPGQGSQFLVVFPTPTPSGEPGPETESTAGLLS
ncbi:ATP-binding protein [Paludibaculum fermentans]|uniref:ATP-binding protein n=1 Tax=Paludibaculum fermentans TaxID=1473598 RepID=UPI003EBE222F